MKLLMLDDDEILNLEGFRSIYIRELEPAWKRSFEVIVSFSRASEDDFISLGNFTTKEQAAKYIRSLYETIPNMGAKPVFGDG